MSEQKDIPITMTYAEYLNYIKMKHKLKKNLQELNMPFTEIYSMEHMTEEQVFLRNWDVETFGLNNNTHNCNQMSSKMWLEEEQDRLASETILG